MASLTQLSIGLVGKTGGGKSTLGNALLGEDVFKTSKAMESETVTCESAQRNVGNFCLTVVDTPGTMDTQDQLAAFEELHNTIRACPEGFDAFLVVLKTGRFTDEEYEGVMNLKKIFGNEMMKHTIILYTHAEHFNNDNEFNVILNDSCAKIPRLNCLIKECGNRIFMVDNSKNRNTAVHAERMNNLLNMVLALRNQNGGKYTNALFKRVQREIEEKRRLEEETERRVKMVEENRRVELELVKSELKIVKSELEKQQMKQELEMEKLRNEMRKEMLKQTQQWQSARADYIRMVQKLEKRWCALM